MQVRHTSIHLFDSRHSCGRHNRACQTLFLILHYNVKTELGYVAEFGMWVDIHRGYKLIQSFLALSFNQSDLFLSSSPIILSANQIAWFFNISPEWLLTLFLYKSLTPWLEPTENVLITDVFGIYWGVPLKVKLVNLSVDLQVRKPEQVLSGAWKDNRLVLLLHLTFLQKYLKIIRKILIIHAKF